MKKTVLLLCFSVILFLSSSAFAANSPDDFDYIITVDDTVTITGYHGNRQKVEIPDKIEDCPVTAIADNAFSPNASSILAGGIVSMDDYKRVMKQLNGNKLIVKVIIPNSVTYIGNAVFANCSNLTEVQLPKNLTEINAYMFYHCDALTNITLPKKLAYVSHSAFEYTGIKNITIPDTVAFIGSKAFANCKQLESITLPNHSIDMGEGVFANCYVPQTIPEWMTKIGNTFKYCEGITDLIIPASEGEVESGAFNACSSLCTVTIEEGVKKINDRAFIYCESLESVVIEEGVTEIGKYAFYQCENLKTIQIPTSVTFIHDTAFEDCRNLDRIIVTKDSYAAQYFRYRRGLILQ